MKKHPQRTKRNIINHHESFETFQAVVLIGLGYSIKLVSEVTGLTRGQQNRVIKAYGLRWSDYRDGRSNTSKLIRRLVGKQLQAVLFNELRQISDKH